MHQTQQSSMIKRIPAFGLSLAMLFIAAGCATGPNRNPNDPLENLNRATFEFNDTLDRTVATPIAKGYNAVVPDSVKTMVYNFFSNIGDVSVMVNNFAQGKVGDGASDLMRITVNSLFGLVGLIDVATPGGLPKHDQDLGLTLGHWGIPSGPYLVLPLFGPSTLRDTAGFVGDSQINPTGFLEPAERNSLFGVNFVSTRARYLGATDLLSAAALDKYSFTRDAYLGRRRSQLGGAQQDTLPDYESESPAGTPANNQPGNNEPSNDKSDGTGDHPANGAARPPGRHRAP
jgi:phospholipid-binding lipoprotein MlaA